MDSARRHAKVVERGTLVVLGARRWWWGAGPRLSIVVVVGACGPWWALVAACGSRWALVAVGGWCWWALAGVAGGHSSLELLRAHGSWSPFLGVGGGWPWFDGGHCQ